MSRDIEQTRGQRITGGLPEAWTFTVNAFNWTQDVVLAEESAVDIAVRIAKDVSAVLELEPGQLWRSFPAPLDAESVALRHALARVGGTVSITGGSIDDWSSPSQRRSAEAREQFLATQLRTASRLGATGVRLPLGHAGLPLLRRVLPLLHDLDLILFEEIQGAQSGEDPASAVALEELASLEDARVRVLVDTSMLMPALPTTYLEYMRTVRVSGDIINLVTDEWLAPTIPGVLRTFAVEGAIPPAARSLYMNMLTRFGRSSASDLAPILPLVGAFHLKFWDLDDDACRVTSPSHDLGALLAATDFRGYLCSEWGGWEWLDERDATTETRAHLSLAKTALSVGAASHF